MINEKVIAAGVWVMMILAFLIVLSWILPDLAEQCEMRGFQWSENLDICLDWGEIPAGA